MSAPFGFGLGPSLHYLNLGKISGTQIPAANILPDGDPLDYSMKGQSGVLLLEPQIMFTAYRLQPYVFGGIGCAWNTLSNYTETTPPGSGAAPADNLYGAHTEASFASELGAGLQYLVWRGAEQESVGLRAEYRYFNLGQARLGAANGQIGSSRMKANLSANVVDIGIAYHFK